LVSTNKQAISSKLEREELMKRGGTMKITKGL